MDLQRRDQLLLQLAGFGMDADHPRGSGALPLVGIDDFFEGNSDRNSFAPKLIDHYPELDHFHLQLRAIAQREDVSHVLVEAADVEWAYDSDEDWVVATTVVFVTSAPTADLVDWTEGLMAAGPVKGFPEPVAPNAPQIPAGHAAWHVVWR